MSRTRPGLVGASLALALIGGSAQAQQPVRMQPGSYGYRPASYDGYELVPPGIYGGPGYGWTGVGYYYDGPGEGPLVVYPEHRGRPRAKRRR